MQIYMINRIQVNNRPGSHQSHNTRRFTEVDVWCSQFNQVWHHTRNALITQKNSRIDWISKELYITIDVYEILNNQKWAYQSISHEITKYRYWMTSSQSECHCTQWVKINSRKSELTLMRISKRIHQTIKVIDRILILFVSKKDGTKWLCVNYRQLNKITRQDSYFLSLIKELQDG
jgi:hypothetical protein